jgi:hypothetical protein
MYELGSTFHPTPLVRHMVGPSLRSSPLVGMRCILRGGGDGVQGADKGAQELLTASSPRQVYLCRVCVYQGINLSTSLLLFRCASFCLSPLSPM